MKLFSRCFSWQCSWFLVCLSAATLNGCSLISLSGKTEECKRHTYINLVLRDYLKQRFNSQEMVRLAVVPFDVPETFAPPGNESANYGRELARKFQLEMNGRGMVPIAELFNRDRWPGKRAEFFTGNYQAIELARAAGYDLVLVGYMDEIKNDSLLEVYTKLIDTQNQITIWSAKTDVTANARALRKELASWRVGDWAADKERPDLFEFPERTESLVSCTLTGIENEEPKPQ